MRRCRNSKVVYFSDKVHLGLQRKYAVEHYTEATDSLLKWDSDSLSQLNTRQPHFFY